MEEVANYPALNGLGGCDFIICFYLPTNVTYDLLGILHDTRVTQQKHIYGYMNTILRYEPKTDIVGHWSLTIQRRGSFRMG